MGVQIVYTGALDGTLYRINPSAGQETALCSFPDVATANQRVQPFDQYLPAHQNSWYRDIAYIIHCGPMSNLLVIGRYVGGNVKFAVLEASGRIIKDDLPLYGQRHVMPKEIVEKIYEPSIPPT